MSGDRSKSVLCFLEHDDDGVLDASLRALTLARSLASSGRTLVAAFIGNASTSIIDSLSKYAVIDAYQVSIDGT